MGKSILVTGGAGFIGSHLCKRLVENGDFVICIDNLLTGNMNNIINLSENSNFQFIEHDVTNQINLEVEQIYNLACPASPVQYQTNPIQTTKTSFLGALNMLELANSNRGKVLQASTSEIYGNPLVHPQPESYWGNVNPIGVRACYDEGKRVAETLFFDHYRQFKTNIRIARIFNTYGPNMSINDGRVISNFIVQALQHKDITVNGDGKQTRSFCYVSDMVEGLICFMNYEHDFTGPLNIGNPNEITINEIAQKIIELTKSNSKIIFNGLPEDDPLKRNPKIDLAINKLQWQPSVNLTEGLLNTISYFSNIL